MSSWHVCGYSGGAYRFCLAASGRDRSCILLNLVMFFPRRIFGAITRSLEVGDAGKSSANSFFLQILGCGGRLNCQSSIGNSGLEVSPAFCFVSWAFMFIVDPGATISVVASIA